MSGEPTPPVWKTLFESDSARSHVLALPSFDRDALAQARTAYYPGAGADGDAFRVFGAGGAADVIIHADYGVSPEAVVDTLRSEVGSGGLCGYAVATVQYLAEGEVYRKGWVKHVDTSGRRQRATPASGSFAVWVRLRRAPALDDDHGPELLGFLHVMDCGIRAFDALFCQRAGAGVVGVVVQDHGWGGNWSGFGEGSPLQRLARRFGEPGWLLVADGSTVWSGFEAVGATGETGPGGMHGAARRLFRRFG